MDLALNNLERLICHKTQPTNIAKIVYDTTEFIWFQNGILKEGRK